MIDYNSLASIELHKFGLEVGSSAIIGGIIGFASKKVAKLLLFFVGLELAFLQVLEIYGLIDVKWAAINGIAGSLQKMVQQDTPPPDLVTVLSSLSIGGGFVGGFMLGFKRA